MGIIYRFTYLLICFVLVSCASTYPAAITSTSLPIIPTVGVSPTTTKVGVETLEPITGFTPALLMSEVITPKNAHEVKPLESLGNSLSSGGGPVAFSPQGDILAAGDYEGPMKLYSMATGVLLAKLETQIGFVNCIAFSPDGKLIAAGGGIYEPVERGVQIWDVATYEQLLKLDDFDEAVRGLAFGPNGAILATADGHPWSGRGSAKIWDIKTGKLLTELTIQGKTNQLYLQAYADVAFNPAGTFLAAINTEGKVQIWDVINHKEAGMMTGVAGEGTSVAFSPDGKLLAASGSASDGDTTADVRLWNLATGVLLFKLEGHTAAVQRVAFSPNGQILASTSWDGSVRLWDVKTGVGLAVLQVPNVSSVAFRPDGTLLATSGYGDAVRLWGVLSQ